MEIALAPIAGTRLLAPFRLSVVGTLHPAADVLVGWVRGLLSRQLQANRHDLPPAAEKL